MTALFKDLGQLFKGNTLEHALQSFDKATMLIVATAWTVALLVAGVATFAVITALNAKQELVKLLTAEPPIVKIDFKPAAAADMKPVLERIKKRYPELKTELAKDSSIVLFSDNPADFRQWLFALNYADSISPQLRWSIRALCVGSKCTTKSLMHATLRAEKVAFVVSDDAPVKEDAKTDVAKPK